MKKTLLPLLVLLGIVACRKEPVTAVANDTVSLPAMRVIDLHDSLVRYGRIQTIDLNEDGAYDFVFKLQLVGAPSIGADRYQLCVQSGIKRNLLVNGQDETLPFSSGASIGNQYPGFQWWEISQSVLAEKVVSNSEHWWDGLWKGAQHRFLAVQVQQGAGRYNGFVELSIDTAGTRMILHRAAINLSPDVPIVAGK